MSSLREIFSKYANHSKAVPLDYDTKHLKSLCDTLKDSSKSPLYNTRKVIEVLEGEETNG